MSDHPTLPSDPQAPCDADVRLTIDPAPPERATVEPARPPGEETAHDLPARIGRFEVFGFLGAGSFGTVYHARDPQLDREIALKVAKATSLSPERLARFRREARAAAGLRHPHIVPLFEAGETDGQLFLASAYIPGTTLEDAVHERRERGGFSPREAATIVQKLAEALAYAHGQGLLHRDVKSGNVMLDPDGEPHLLDFGLARRFDDLDRMTHDGAVLGTPAYMAPEVTRGQRENWTAAVDQYALGAVLYELLTGRTPFGGPLEVVIALQQVQEPEGPRRLNRAVPRDLEAVCLKCLEKDASRRYAGCASLAEDLGRWLVGAPTAARPLGAGERLLRWMRQNRALAAALTAAAAFLLVG